MKLLKYWSLGFFPRNTINLLTQVIKSNLKAEHHVCVCVCVCVTDDTHMHMYMHTLPLALLAALHNKSSWTSQASPGRGGGGKMFYGIVRESAANKIF